MVEPSELDHKNLAFKALLIYAGIVLFSVINYYVVTTNFEIP